MLDSDHQLATLLVLPAILPTGMHGGLVVAGSCLLEKPYIQY
jgi:hypothetical protein